MYIHFKVQTTTRKGSILACIYRLFQKTSINMSLLTDFYWSVPPIEGINDADYESLRHYVVTLEATARMIDLSYYIIDYKKREFIIN